MKKFFLFVFVLGIFTTLLHADQFKIFYGLSGPQNLTDIQLDLQLDNQYPLTTVYLDPISPSEFSLTDSSVTISFPDGYNKIYFSCNIMTEETPNFFTATVNPELNYRLGYDGQRYFLTLFTM